ncbi:MAG: carbohydrate-binding domain-containing protein [Firmicutes bacterium]|nr:carbohydrate-binding domain-containing protein [Bacillota bacterium]
MMRKTEIFAIVAFFTLAMVPVGASAGTEAPDFASATAITLGSTITVKGTGATVTGSTVKITSGGSYTISGTLADGYVEVNTKEKVYIELNGANITNPKGPAILITDAKRASITLKSGTTSCLTDAKNSGEYDACLFSNDTLEIRGAGTLIVTGKNEEGIASDDDAIIEGGNIRITAEDDGINAHDDITINGGYVYILAKGDAIDSNGTVNINGGTAVLQGGNTGGKGGVDSTGPFTITGGTVIATGNHFTRPDANSTQASIFVITNQVSKAATPVSINLAGKEVLTFAPAREFVNIFFSAPGLVKDAQYGVYIGGSVDGTGPDGIYAAGRFAAAANANPLLVTAAVSPAGMGF